MLRILPKDIKKDFGKNYQIIEKYDEMVQLAKIKQLIIFTTHFLSPLFCDSNVICSYPFRYIFLKKVFTKI